MTAPTLATITTKVHAGERLTADDALALAIAAALCDVHALALQHCHGLPLFQRQHHGDALQQRLIQRHVQCLCDGVRL